MDRKAGISLALGIGLSLAGQVLSRVLERAGLGILAYMVLGISGLILLRTWHRFPRRRDIGLLSGAWVWPWSVSARCLAYACFSQAGYSRVRA